MQDGKPRFSGDFPVFGGQICRDPPFCRVLSGRTPEGPGGRKGAERPDFPGAARRLPERERQVIALRFYHGLTQQRAAELLHISQVQVSRLERRAVERMRVWLDA